MKVSAIEPGDDVEFHHHNRGLRHGVYVGRMGRHHHHVAHMSDSRPSGGHYEHLEVHEGEVTRAHHHRHRARNKRLMDVHGDLRAEGRNHEDGDLAPNHALAGVERALGA